VRCPPEFAYCCWPHNLSLCGSSFGHYEHDPDYTTHSLRPQRMSSTVRFSRAPSTTGWRPGSGRMEEDASAALADKALAAFVIIHAMLKRSRRLQTFCERPDIKARFPGYAVRSHT